MQRLLNVIACALVGLAALTVGAIYWTQRPPAEDRPTVWQPTYDGKSQLPQRPVAQPPKPEVVDPAAAVSTDAPTATPKQYALAEIEAELDRLRSERAARPQASDELAVWYDNLATPSFTQSSDYEAHLAKLAKWREEAPQSPTPLIALAKSQIEYAWQARGGDVAATVTDEGWKLFGERIAEARKLLEEAIALGVKDGEAHALLIKVSMAQGWPLDESQAVLDAGRKLDPLYYGLYPAMALNLLPRWNGEAGDAEKFAAEIAAALPGDDGLEAYGRIAASLDCLDRTLVYWGEFDAKQLAAAARVLLDRHPDRSRLVSYAARFAWIADDQKIGQRARSLLKGQPDLLAWGLESRFKEFELWCDCTARPSGEKAQAWGSLLRVQGLAFAPNTRFVWCNAGDRQVAAQLIDTQSGKPRSQLPGFGGGINRFSFEPANNLLIAVGTTTGQKGAIVWNVKRPLSPLPIPTENGCFSVAASPAAPLVAVHDGKQVKLISLNAPQDAKTLEASDEYINNLVFSPDGKLLAVHARNYLSVWDVEAAEKKYELATYDARPQPEMGLARPLAFDDESRLLAVALRKNATHPLVHYTADGSGQDVLGELPMSVLATLSPDRKLVALSSPKPRQRSEPAAIEIWDVATSKMRQRLAGHTSRIEALAFSADSKELASGSADGRVKIWDVRQEE